jgi:putative transposase
VARCTVERLMRDLGLPGLRRGKTVRTTVPGTGGHRAGDLLRLKCTGVSIGCDRVTGRLAGPE